jgi:hypothetical protein
VAFRKIYQYFFIHDSNMQKFWRVCLIAVCGIAVLTAGCTDEELGVTPPPTTTAIATAITVPTTTPTPEPTLFIPEYTNPPATTVETKPVKPPLPSPVQGSGLGFGIVGFTTEGPGAVRIKINYTSAWGNVTNCDEETYSVKLAGKSIDQRLFYGIVDNPHDQKTTFNLISPGYYTLSVRGCHGWKIDLDNA